MASMQLRVPCIHCDHPISYPADLAGRRVLCPKCRQDFRLPPLEIPEPKIEEPLTYFPPVKNQKKPASAVVEAAYASRGIIHRYMNWCGKRSLIFQVVLIAWSLFWSFFFMASVFGMVGDKNRYEGDGTEAAIGMAIMCCFGTWSIVGIPLIFAVIATLKEREKV